ncbi:MAG: helix-turn-helix domain-containing protein [Porticoccaceae bacterium]|nr:helix-turn-helix domain-containing protein [Porticoccaceae bacterium]
MNAKNGLKWFSDVENHDDFWIEKAKIGFAVSVDRQLASQKVNRAGLAERLKKSAAYITKLLRGDENLTIASMVRIARALNCELHIHMAPKAHQVHWVEKINGTRSASGSVIKKPVARNLSKTPVWAQQHAA